MKIVLIIPDGVVVRNYLYSNFVNELTSKGAEIYVFHQIPKAAIEQIGLVTQSIKEYHFIPYFTESFLARISREIAVYARLLRNRKQLKNDTIRYFWSRNKKGLKGKFLLTISEIGGFLASKSYQSVLFLERLYDRQMLKSTVLNQLSKEIDRIQPNLILNLHQRSMTSAPIINYAKTQKIPTAAVIYSWDNVPKARMIGRYDSYFVWSELMKNELETLYPDIKSQQVKVVGTPQFEFYFDQRLYQSKADFFAKYQLDETKKVVCFSSNDTSSPYDSYYLEDLCGELMQLPEKERPQVLFRINPFDKSGRFKACLQKYSDLIVEVNPDWRTENPDDDNFINIFPSYNDIAILVNTVLHSDVVVNLGSTMSHDFAVLDKPCLYFNYDPVSNSKLKVEDVYQFQHFRSMKGLEAVGWINSKSEFNSKILTAIQQPNQVGKDRKRWMERIVQHPLDKNSQNLANEIVKICTSV